MARDPLHNVTAVQHDKVLIVDFRSQVTQLIARRVREVGVYCEIAPVQNEGPRKPRHPFMARRRRKSYSLLSKVA